MRTEKRKEQHNQAEGGEDHRERRVALGTDAGFNPAFPVPRPEAP